MKQIRWIIILCVLFLFSSCSIGLLAVHEEPPFLCFKKKCREMAKNGGNKQSYQKSKQIKARKKRKTHQGRNNKRVKKHNAPSF